MTQPILVLSLSLQERMDTPGDVAHFFHFYFHCLFHMSLPSLPFGLFMDQSLKPFNRKGRVRVRACTLKWRFACLREAASAKAGHAGVLRVR
jgi:hypothetical protein